MAPFACFAILLAHSLSTTPRNVTTTCLVWNWWILLTSLMYSRLMSRPVLGFGDWEGYQGRKWTVFIQTKVGWVPYGPCTSKTLRQISPSLQDMPWGLTTIHQSSLWMIVWSNFGTWELQKMSLLCMTSSCKNSNLMARDMRSAFHGKSIIPHFWTTMSYLANGSLVSSWYYGNPQLFLKYDPFICDQIGKGILEVVAQPVQAVSDQSHYLPQHGIFCQDKATSKLQIVFDASTRSTGPPLNDYLYYIGLKFNQSIFGILLCFAYKLPSQETYREGRFCKGWWFPVFFVDTNFIGQEAPTDETDCGWCPQVYTVRWSGRDARWAQICILVGSGEAVCLQAPSHGCVVCRKMEGNHLQPLFGYLVQSSKPFDTTGKDFANPLHVRVLDVECSKVWLCLYTRAVHLDLVLDMSMTAVTSMRRFVRFTARRWTPSLVISDNPLETITLQRAWFTRGPAHRPAH